MRLWIAMRTDARAPSLTLTCMDMQEWAKRVAAGDEELLAEARERYEQARDGLRRATEDEIDEAMGFVEEHYGDALRRLGE